jgi:large subunit ribosomal protein L15
MKLHDLAPAEGAHKKRRRLGRGHGSGRVKTAGRGTKGQNARSGKGVKPWFEGGQNPWTMKIPHRRGFSRARFKVVAQVVNLRDLEATFAAGDVVNQDTLRQRGLVEGGARPRPVKLLGDGTLTKRLVVEVHRASATARAAVESAGGQLTVLEPPRQKSTRARAERAARPAAEPAAEPAESPATEPSGEPPAAPAAEPAGEDLPE